LTNRNNYNGIFRAVSVPRLWLTCQLQVKEANTNVSNSQTAYQLSVGF